jgi:hypothetical protein
MVRHRVELQIDEVSIDAPTSRSPSALDAAISRELGDVIPTSRLEWIGGDGAPSGTHPLDSADLRGLEWTIASAVRRVVEE